MRFKEMLRYAANVSKKDPVDPRTVTSTDRPLFNKIEKHYSTPRPKRDRRIWKYRQLTSGVPITMRRIKRPWSDKMILDTRPRTDGKPGCPECGHNRFKTVCKFENGQRKIACRYCESEVLI